MSQVQKPLNGTTTRDTFCTACTKPIPKGTRVAIFKERALSYREAQNAGTMYPRRLWCAKCAGHE